MATTADHRQSSLTPAEQALIEHVERGEVLDLAGDGQVDEAAMRAWDDTRTISATVIRDILRGRHVADPDPHGLRLRGARIHGRLDLENITSTIGLEFTDCLLLCGINARDADLGWLVLAGCRLGHPTEPPLDASRLATTLLDLGRATITAHSWRGAVYVSDAHLGALQCEGSRLVNDAGPALAADSLRTVQSVVLREGFEAIGSGEQGAVRLPGARLGGQLSCSGARLSNDSGPALVADGLQVDHDVILVDGFEAIGSGEQGAVRLPGARLGGQFSCSGARLSNDSGPALHADRLRVDDNVFLSRGFVATASSEEGAVRLLSAYVGGQLDCSGAHLSNDSGPALAADDLKVDHDVSLVDGFEAIGSGGRGAVRLLGAHLGGEFQCSGARLCNDSGPALAASALRVDQNVRFNGGFEATGAGDDGAVRLSGAHFGGGLDFSGARLSNDSGPSLDAVGLQVDQGVYLIDGFEAIGGGDDVVLDLSYAAIRGALIFIPDRLDHVANPDHLLGVDGMTYTGLPLGITPEDWLALLRYGTPAYAAQPYQHLAAAHRATGHDREARRVLIAQRRDQIRRRALTSRAERTWARFTGLLLGYGYKPWRALIALTIVLTAAVLAAVILGGSYGALAQVRTPPPATPTPCTWVDEVGVGLDLGTPLITTGTRTRCDSTDTPPGRALTIIGWFLRLLAWAFATLFIAGFTGAVRKT